MDRSLISAFFIVLSLHACKQEESVLPDLPCMPYDLPASDKYTFPLRPGMPEWADLKSGQEKIDVCQLPDSIIRNISTPGLLESCLDYPLLSTMVAFYSIQTGVENQLDNFNGFQELEKRENTGQLMLARYEQMRPDCFPKEGTSVEQGHYSLEFVYFGMILSQPRYLRLMSEAHKSLMKMSLTKYYSMLEYPDVYWLLSYKVQAYLMAQIMLLNDYEKFTDAVNEDENLQVFVEYADLQNNYNTLDLIVEHAKLYSN